VKGLICGKRNIADAVWSIEHAGYNGLMVVDIISINRDTN
jgi:hypothetical protein